MNTRVSSLEMWRRSLGMCMVCGQPMGLKSRIAHQDNNRGDEVENEEFGLTLENVVERMLLVEECPIRMAFIQFNESFGFLMLKNEETFKGIDKIRAFESFITQVIKSSNEILETAIANCKRMGDNFLFAGCRRCNLSMNKPNFHVDTVYRCFEITKNMNTPFLESRNVKAIKIKKLIQQIAFYFDF